MLKEFDLSRLHSEKDWLQLFAHLGAQAQKLLAQKDIECAPAWNRLADDFFARAFPPVPPSSVADYRRWLKSLLTWAGQNNIREPSALCREHAAAFASHLRDRGASPSRRFRFYRRVWQTLDLDKSVWKVRESLPLTNGEHYRRLTTAEVKRLVKTARAANQDIADIILIGYWTGLRLSDVTELEKSEILIGKRQLKIVPNKVRSRKRNPLTIPLVNDAEMIARRRYQQAGSSRYLFPETCRHRISRQIVAIFRKARILKIGNGRASFHSLRATFISLMDEAGIQPYITDAITGHAPGGMHARYTQPSPAILRRAIARAIPLVG